jgi:uncharacterized SAM-binding protein YcdF (DUF218 family)
LGRLFGVLLIAAALAAGWDFLRFVDRASATVPVPPPAGAEAVAALTGGSNARIAVAVQLAGDLGLPLMISGVHPDASTADIAEIAGVSEEAIVCCVTLGRAAATTVGNGLEISAWARDLGVSRIVVVTSDYHMERAMLELRRSMPEADLHPHAVGERISQDWWRDGAAARALAAEWAKYRVSSFGAAPVRRIDLADVPA